MMVPPPVRQATSWGAFVLWALVGGLFLTGLLAVFTIFMFAFWALAIVATVLLARSPATHRGSPGLISGLGLPPLLVAYLNRQGPGTVCHMSSVGRGCTQEWSPWPWLGAGGGMILAGVVVFAIVNRRARKRRRRLRPVVHGVGRAAPARERRPRARLTPLRRG